MTLLEIKRSTLLLSLWDGSRIWMRRPQEDVDGTAREKSCRVTAMKMRDVKVVQLFCDNYQCSIRQNPCCGSKREVMFSDPPMSE